MSQSPYYCTPQKHNDTGYTWYECNCCPYGYHIDLDFVRYCEYVGQEVDTTGSIKRRKDRRRQRQSMEVLLGITPPVLPVLEESFKIIEQKPQRKSINTNETIGQDIAFDNAVCDFEKTLQHSKNKVINNLPDVTAVSGITKGAVSMDLDNVETCGLSPFALQNIRKQMALSLERTKQLENQVKLIPELKHQLAELKEENNYLQMQLKSYKDTELNVINSNYLQPRESNNRIRSQSVTDIDNLDTLTKKRSLRKDCGIMCSVLTRNIGVGHQYPNTKHVSTTTTTPLNNSIYFINKSFKDGLNNFSNNRNDELFDYFLNNNLISKSSQTIESKRTISCQTIEKSKIVLQKIDKNSQTVDVKKNYFNASIMAIPSYCDFNVQKTVDVKSIGVSNDTINDIICEKCNIIQKTIDTNKDIQTSSISLASLAFPRSKSFNLEGEGLNLRKNASKACQYDINGVSKASQYDIISPTKACQYDIVGITRACQYEIKTQSKSCQQDIKLFDKGVQCKEITVEKKLNPIKINIGCQVEEQKPKLIAIGSNTQFVTEKNQICTKCFQKEKDIKKEITPTQSKIPRPQAPTTPVEKRKFRRQDTYTKTYATPEKLVNSNSILEFTGIDSPESTKEEQNFSLLTVSLSNIDNCDTNKTTTNKSVPESVVFDQSLQTYRKKKVPSKEMLAAMKVLNDSLQKPQTSNVKNHTAINIIQQEWFKLSSLPTTNPQDLEDYLDAFENVSPALIEYIVNLTDASGNTAMHYAVSHGNFDIVSILLDSKVCDINKPNKAGYTSVMLASLAEVQSPTHIKVVQRLFQLSDVNIRAKQYGQTALMLAVSHGHINMVKMLLEAGADINIQDEDGSTALMCAAEHGYLEIVKLFLNHPDCDSTITDVDGSTALKIVMEAGHRHIGVLLYAHQRNLQQSRGTKFKKTKSTSSIKSEH